MLEDRKTEIDVISDAPKLMERPKLAEPSLGRVICQTSNTRPVRDQNATKSRPANGRDLVAQKAPLTGDFIEDSSASHRFAITGDPSLPTKKIGDYGGPQFSDRS